MILAAVLNYLTEQRPEYDWQPQWHNSEMVRIASMSANVPLYYIEYFPDRNIIEIIIVDDHIRSISDQTMVERVNAIDLCDTNILDKLGQIVPNVSAQST